MKSLEPVGSHEMRDALHCVAHWASTHLMFNALGMLMLTGRRDVVLPTAMFDAAARVQGMPAETGSHSLLYAASKKFRLNSSIQFACWS
jgi:hypothetical protein